MTSQEQTLLPGLAKEYSRIFNVILKVIQDDTFCLRPCLRIIRWTFGRDRAVAELIVFKFMDRNRFSLQFRTHYLQSGDFEFRCSEYGHIARFVSSIQDVTEVGNVDVQLDDFVEVQTSAIA
jgi:hypothetical protein